MKKLTFLTLVIVILSGCSKDSSNPEPTTPTPTPTPPTGGSGNGGGNGGDTPSDSSLISTYSFSAQIDDSQTPNAEVSSYLDDNNNTHIAWIKDDGSTRDLMYTVFSATSKTFSTQTAVSGVQDEKMIAPEIITDNSNNPHIVFFKKRDVNSGSNNGNYAVMYATSTGGTFTSNQVSTNPTDPSIEDDGLYNCYVNGRPSIYLDDGVIKVSYQADANTNTSWDNYLITATQNGSSWTREQTLNIDDTYGNDNPDRGFSFPQYCTGNLYAGYIDISSYNPHFASEASSWANTTIPGYSGVLGTNKHIQVEQDYGGTTHLSWFNTENDKFCHTTINNGSYTAITETSTINAAHGNFYPVAIDRTYGDYIMFYHDFSGNGYLVYYNYDTNDGSFLELKINSEDFGTIYGKRALFYNNEYFSLTTANNSEDRIYVTILNE